MKIQLDIALFLVTLFWTIWLVIKSYNTQCINLIDSCITISLLYIQIFTRTTIMQVIIKW